MFNALTLLNYQLNQNCITVKFLSFFVDSEKISQG